MWNDEGVPYMSVSVVTFCYFLLYIPVISVECGAVLEMDI
jgi:hypothetical protein